MKVFIGAGEESGDFLGATLIAELKKRYPTCKIIGIGGPQMKATGLSSSLFPMNDLSLMGFFEICPKIPKILYHLWQTKHFILKEKPDVIVTIDAPDFYLRLLKTVKKISRGIPTIHYNAPAVWASRPKRAEKMALFVDHLLCVLPFEPPYFTRHGMQATFIGHPLTQLKETCLPFSCPHQTPITVLFGSRTQEIKRLTQPFIQACQYLQKDFPDLYLFIPTFDRFKEHLRRSLDQTTLSYEFIDPQNKTRAFRTSKAALAASGTVTLELAKAGLPFVVGYKLSPLTYQIAKRVVITPYVCLVNVLLQEPLIPECLQKECNPDTLYKHLKALLTTSDLSIFKEKLKSAYAQLLPPHNATSSALACDIIEKHLNTPSHY